MYLLFCLKLFFNYICMLLLNEIKIMYVGWEVINVIFKLIFIICLYDIYVFVLIYINSLYNENIKWGIVI